MKRAPVVSRILLLAMVGSIVQTAACQEVLEKISNEHEGGTLTGNHTWTQGTHKLLGSITINEGVLTVERCSVIQMPVDGVITVSNNGALKLLGDAACPVRITSSKSSPAPGDWGYIEFYSSGDNLNNTFSHAVIEHGGGSGYGAIWLESDASLEMHDSIVQHSADFGMQLNDGARLRNFSANTLKLNTKGPIELTPDAVADLGAGTYSGNTVDGISIVGGTVTRDATWRAHDAPYVAESFNVRAETGSAQLTIQAGATLKLKPSAVVAVQLNGGLKLAGTADAGVSVISQKTAPAAGDWHQIEFYDDSIDGANMFSYATINHGGGSSYGQIWLEGGAALTLDHVQMAQAGEGCDIAADLTSTISATDSAFEMCE